MTPTPIRDYDQGVDVVRTRIDEIGLSLAFLDEMIGLQNGYMGKLLGPARVKNISLRVFLEICEATAMKVTVEPDLEAAQRMSTRWERRDELRRRPGVIRKRFSPELLQKVASEIARARGSKPKQFRLSFKERQKINRRNGKKGGRPVKNGSPPSVKSGSSGAYAIPAKAVRRAPSASQSPPG